MGEGQKAKKTQLSPFVLRLSSLYDIYRLLMRRLFKSVASLFKYGK